MFRHRGTSSITKQFSNWRRPSSYVIAQQCPYLVLLMSIKFGGFMCKTFHECCYYVACQIDGWWPQSSCAWPYNMTIWMYIECKQLVGCLVWLIFLELHIYHIAKLKLLRFPKTQCIQCTVVCYVLLCVHRVRGHGHEKMTTLSHLHTKCRWTKGWKMWTKGQKGVVLSRLTFKQSPHSID